MAAMANIRSVTSELSTEESAIRWVRENGFVPTSMECPLCGIELEVSKKGRFGRFACRKTIAGHEVYGQFEMAAANNTLFSCTRLSIVRVMLIIYGFARKFSYEQTRLECWELGQPDVSSQTIADWFSYMREVCRDSLDRRYSAHATIGGPDHVVEVEEWKIGQRKLECSRVIEGMWILGMIDRETKEVRLEIYPENCRSSDSLVPLIRKHVAPKTTIMTDCWKRYDDLTERNFKHMAVIHSLKFVNPVTRACTNTINSAWSSLRHRLSRGGVCREDMDGHLCEYLWRMDCVRLGRDSFLQLLDDIRLLYPGGIPEYESDSE